MTGLRQRVIHSFLETREGLTLWQGHLAAVARLLRCPKPGWVFVDGPGRALLSSRVRRHGMDGSVPCPGPSVRLVNNLITELINQRILRLAGLCWFDTRLGMAKAPWACLKKQGRLVMRGWM